MARWDFVKFEIVNRCYIVMSPKKSHQAVDTRFGDSIAQWDNNIYP